MIFWDVIGLIFGSPFKQVGNLVKPKYLVSDVKFHLGTYFIHCPSQTLEWVIFYDFVISKLHILTACPVECAEIYVCIHM